MAHKHWYDSSNRKFLCGTECWLAANSKLRAVSEVDVTCSNCIRSMKSARLKSPSAAITFTEVLTSLINLENCLESHNMKSRAKELKVIRKWIEMNCHPAQLVAVKRTRYLRKLSKTGT